MTVFKRISRTSNMQKESNQPYRLVTLVIMKSFYNLKSETQQNYLGVLWWVLEPLLYVLVIYFFLIHILGRGDDRYFLILISGMIPWLWFLKSLNVAAGSLIAGKPVIIKYNVPVIIFPTISVFQLALKQTLIFFILLVGFLIFGSMSFTDIVIFALLMLLQLLLIANIAVILSILVVLVRDLLIILPSLLSAGMFVSGVFYDYRDLPASLHKYYDVNPMAILLAWYRDVLVYSNGVDTKLIFLSIIVQATLFYLLYLITRRIRPKLVFELTR